MKSCNGFPEAVAIILCAGSGERTNLGYNKILYHMGKTPLLELTLGAFSRSAVSRTVLVINERDETQIREIADKFANVTIAYGGDARTDSVRNGLKAAADCGIAVIHDGARPFVSPALINATIESAAKFGSGIAAVPATDTVKECEANVITRGLDRSKLMCMQTPQSFDYKAICAAYDSAQGSFTDDAAVWTNAGNIARIVAGEYENVKVTTPADLFRGAPARSKIGLGFDVHKLVPDRKLVLGGVTVPHCKGLLGHSDADALAHAITDSILSAAGLPDIGVLFPDTDPSTEGISSMVFLKDAVRRITELGYIIGNISAVIMAQKPKLAPHIEAMRQTLAEAANIRISQINVSATTTETLGITGEEKGIAASATCLLFY
ncbi:2-C-methyl-D-erythritol 2,4-cyclodiphosphate synthase [Pumilibacter intestinalis]|uniref:2-C-methyl-D-erythritol 2,4-cyclodiphosphate synthase n=1 Tax=Pumilibacter intestinalis TaxID=2941511 RepID=UPI00203E5890|nr:2-C-methyl-D-erythritol 2,4-cyclodiphosphate synthase [Pumilibacter intestinalis]